MTMLIKLHEVMCLIFICNNQNISHVDVLCGSCRLPCSFLEFRLAMLFIYTNVIHHSSRLLAFFAQGGLAV